MTYKDIDGWFNFEPIYDMAVKAARDYSVLVEIGCWKGKSTAYMAQKIKESGKDIKFWAIDIWVDSPLMEFCHNMQKCDLMGFVNPIPLPSMTAVKKFPASSVDFVFIDGDHSYQAVRDDIKEWYKRLKKGGMLAGHDYHAAEVKQAVDEFCQKHNYQPQFHENSWYFTKR